MTSAASDREAIRHLMAVYNINGDRGRITALGETFIEDGILEFSGETITGRAAIVSRLSRGRERHPALELSRHHITTSLIELDGDRATARSYFQVLTNGGLDHHGHYADQLTRMPQGWRIAHRSVRIDYQSADSLYPPFHVRGRVPD